METDLAALHVNASRAYGTAATNPFASTLADTAQLKKVLDDNGAPASDRHLVIDTSAGAAMRTLTQLTNVNQSADSTMLRQGELLNVHNFAIRESAQVKNLVTAGTGTGYTSSTAGFAVGVTDIALITGSGTVIAGDVVTFTGDTNKYMVDVGVAAPGTITIAEPGLKKALAASAVAMTIVAASTRNLAFSRNAIVLATRTPALPDGGDLAVDRTVITDPYSGLSFELSMYAQYRQMQYEVSAAWGVGAMKDEHMAVLLGG